MSKCWRIAVVAALLGVVASGCGGPPQLGPDREAFRTVDAMFTAVSLREVPPLERCEAKLKALNEAGKLPGSAYNALESIAEEAKGGHWESAQGRLREFMRGQRR